MRSIGISFGVSVCLFIFKMLLFHHCNGISIRDPEPQAARPRSFRKLKPPRVRLRSGWHVKGLYGGFRLFYWGLSGSLFLYYEINFPQPRRGELCSPACKYRYSFVFGRTQFAPTDGMVQIPNTPTNWNRLIQKRCRIAIDAFFCFVIIKQ